jgi:hypothetical protein
MHTLVIATCLFAVSLLVHLIVWRVRLPDRHSATLLAIFTGCLVVWVVAGWIAPGNPTASRDRLETIHVALVQIALALAYVVGYSAIEHRSPSMTLLLAVAAAKDEGLSRRDLHDLLAASLPVDARLDAMVRDGTLVNDASGYRLAPQGRVWEAALGGWRRLIGLPRGG